MNTQTILVMLALLSSTPLRRAADPAEKPETKGPLAALPSAPAPHLEKIRALGDNSWLDLGSPKPDPKWGKACGRAWSPRAAFAPELRGAFYFGEGPHGMVKPNGHYMDDLWFYDIHQHRWFCIYPGIDAKKYAEIELNADGFECGPDGHPLPIASMVHAYSMITYDNDRRLFLSMPCPGAYWKRIEGRKEALAEKKLNETYASPWMYNVVEEHWDRVRTQSERPKSSFGATLVYVPTVKKCFYYYRKGYDDPYWYDPDARDWTKIADKGPRPPFGYDAVSCYDTKRDRIWIGGGQSPIVETGNSLWSFDVRTETWIDPKPQGAPGSLVYPTNQGMLHYDSVNDTVLLFFYRPNESAPQGKGIFAYHPEESRWETVCAERPAALEIHRARTAFYDPQLNVHFLYAATDGRDNGVMWAYRYRTPKN